MRTQKIKRLQLKRIGLLTTIILTTFILTLVSGINDIHSSPSADVVERWRYSLPSQICPAGGTDCHISSPVLADLDNDNLLEIIVATNNGHIVALNQSNGSVRWNRDISTYFGAAANTNEITSSPAVADIDKDGQMEVVVGTGSTDRSNCTQGGVIVLNHNGQVQSGWPKLAYDTNNNGCRESFFSTPALGDLTNDGYLEIVIGGFDKRLYAWRYDGTLLPGFPADSYLKTRFPSWGFDGILADTIWSSPALADLDADGYQDIIIGTDEGNFDARWGGDSGGWTCPYTLPSGWPEGYCGGSLYVLDRFGQPLPGFPKYILEIIQSTPAVADINANGSPEIFVGTGSFYYNNSPDHPTYGFRLHAWDSNGNDLPGWEGGKVVNNVVSASPAIGDIAGDKGLEIVVGTKAGTLYAWHTNGQPVSGFPMTPIDRFGNTYPYGQSFILGDYDGDSKMEIFFNQASMVTIVDGTGTQLTQANGNSDPAYRTWGANRNSPTVGDIDNDGKLELVAHSDQLFVWDLNASSDAADWPMFRQNAARTGYQALPTLHISPSSLVTLHETGDGDDVVFSVVLACDSDEPINWTANESDPDITLSSASGMLMDTMNLTITIDRSGLVPGKNTLESVLVTGTIEGQNVVNSPVLLPVTVYLVDQIHQVFLPGISR